MPMRRTTSATIFALLLGATAARAQSADGSRVFFDAVSFAGPTRDSTLLDLFLAVPYGVIAFERGTDSFTATYRVRLELLNGGRPVFDTTFERTASTRLPEVAAAQRPTYDFFQQRLHLAPGEYDARVEIIDPRTTFVMNARRPVTVADYQSRPFALSGLLLVERIREDSAGFVMTPRLTDEVSSDASGFFVFFESYNGADEIDTRVDAIFRNDRGVEVARRSYLRTFPALRSQQWIRLDAEGIARGGYMLELRASAADDTTRQLATTHRSIRVESGAAGLPSGDAELDERITQLRYVAMQSDIDAIRDAATPAEKRKRYAEFWSRLDPTPGTPTNEAMVEYFDRIDYAREHFQSYADGWMTDQGRVFVIYGPPDNVVRDPFRADARKVETWQYYARGNLEVVFQDDSGFGDFRLVTPLNQLEKYRYGR